MSDTNRGYADRFETEKIDHGRRLFNKSAAAAALATAMPTADAQWSNRKEVNSFNVLNKFSFVNQDGKIISGNQLKSMVGANPFTVSFGFEGCTNFCPTGNSVIGSLTQGIKGGIKHIIINSYPDNSIALPTKRDPVGEIIRAEFREGYKKSILTNKDKLPTGAREDNLIILYPIDRANKPSNDVAQDISVGLGNPTRSDPENHTAVLGLYSQAGDYLSHEIVTPNTNNGSVVRKFMDALPKVQGAAR